MNSVNYNGTVISTPLKELIIDDRQLPKSRFSWGNIILFTSFLSLREGVLPSKTTVMKMNDNSCTQ